MERATKKVKVTLLDGSEKEVEIYKFLNYFERQDIVKQFLEETTIKGNDVYAKIDLSGMMLAISKKLWADKTTKLEDVSAESVDKIVGENLGFFLAGTGATTKKTDNS